ncbi:hypothetical protein QTV49_000366 [Vibrio vulnificus]|nr:hypothetical protein [Vibrio vulnificus]
MGILILVLIVFSAVVGVKHKAKNAESDLPSCVMDGAKDFFIDVKLVIAGLAKKNADKKGVSGDEVSTKDEAEPENKEDVK